MFLIYVATGMSLVPFSWLWRKATQYLPYQYEFGMLAALLAFGHAIIILIGLIDLELMRLIGFEFHLVLQKYVMSKHGFGLANLVGVIALSYGAILAITSNERSILVLGLWYFCEFPSLRRLGERAKNLMEISREINRLKLTQLCNNQDLCRYRGRSTLDRAPKS